MPVTAPMVQLFVIADNRWQHNEPRCLQFMPLSRLIENTLLVLTTAGYKRRCSNYPVLYILSSQPV